MRKLLHQLLMKSYTTINNEIIKLLSLDDIYRYYALSLTVKKEGFSDITIKQLSIIVGESERSLERFPSKLKECNLVIVSLIEGYKRRLTYRFLDGQNYRLITKELLSLPISNQAKGLLIVLCCLTINNTNKCLLSKNKIISKIKASKPTVLRAFKELESTNTIECIKEGFLLPKTVLKIGEKKIVKDLNHLISNNKTCKEASIMKYYNNNPNKVRNMENLSFSLLTGLIHKS